MIGRRNQPDPEELSRQKRALLDHLLREELGIEPGRAGSIPRRQGDGTAPLSPAQQRLWFLEQLQPGTPSYNIPLAVRLRGRLDVPALRRSLAEVVRRHEVLRTTFATVDGRPVQVVSPAWEVSLSVVDLAERASGLRQGELARLAQEEARRPFDLVRGPLLRAVLVRCEDREHVLFLTVHHIVADGWSMGVLVRELAVLYEAFSAGSDSPLPELPIQYADFAVWQREWMRGEVLDRQLAWWKDKLAAPLPVLQLPFDRPRPAVQTANGATRFLSLPGSLARSLRALSRAEAATLFMTLLAAFQTLLHRMSGQEDILVGSPIANRSRPETEGLIGCFANTIVLRADLSGGPSFRKLLQQVRETTLGAYSHQDVPFEKLVEELHPERDRSRQPLFQVVFVLQNAPVPDAELPGLAVGSLEMDSGTAKFDLTLSVEEREDELWAGLEYNTDLFDGETIERMLARFRTLLEGVVADPDLPVWALPLLPDEERRALLEWGRSRREAGLPARCLHELFEQQAARTPDAVALVHEGERLSYRELNERAERLASTLRGLGVGPEVLVGLCLDRSVELVVGILGILKAGGAYVPLDLSYPKERQSLILDDSRAPLLLTHVSLLERLPVHGSLRVCVDAEGRARVLGGVDEMAGAGNGADAGPSTVVPDNPAYVIYTSGSTGRPKGVPVSHANAVRLFEATHDWFQFGSDDVWTLFHSSAFDFSVWELWGALLHGGRLVVVPYWVSRNPQAFRELLAREKVTVLNQTPSSFRMLVQADAEAGVGSELALRTVVFGGEALEPRSLKPWFERHGDRSPRLINMYGITETTVHVTYRPLGLSDLDGAATSVIGGPIPDLRVAILDSHHQLVPVGVPGEMCVGGPGLARGYLGRPERTAERFIPDPFGEAPGGRLYRSGDLARWLPGGDIEYLGRIDHQVKVRGFRIEPGEIEAALDTHPRVRESVVTLRADDGEKRLIAHVVPSSRPAPGVDELREHLRLRLPSYMVPSTFVFLDSLPLTAHGKLNRADLPAPARGRPELQRAYVPPRSAVEKALTEIWAGVLGVERVGIDDNFFALGGDSIRSIQLRGRARERGLDFTIQQLFHHQTVRELALDLVRPEAGGGAVTTDRGGASSRKAPFGLLAPEDRAKVPSDVEDAYPLSQLQAGFVFHSEFSSDYIIYVTSFHLRAPFRLEPMQEALERVVARHPMLRTSFDFRSFAEPFQLVHRTCRISVAVADLRNLQPEEQETRIEEWKREELRRRFDWTRPPLARISVHLRSGDSFQFSLSEPFLDGWSVASLLTELFSHYFILLEGEPPLELTPLDSSYREFVRLEREALESADCRRYWDERLSDATVSRFPRWPRPEERPPDESDPAVGHVEVPVRAEVSDGLRWTARSSSLPLKSVLLAAHLKAVSVLNGQSEVLTGLISNGRPEETDADQLVGVFLNTLPLRVRLKSESWTVLAARAFEAEREMLPFRHYPMAELQRLHGGQSLFDTAFNYTNFHVYQRLAEVDGLEVLDAYGSEQTYFALTAQFNLDPGSSEVSLALDYRCSEVTTEQAERIAAIYSRILEDMAVRPSGGHDALCPLTEPERRLLMEEWNRTARDYPLEQTVHGLIEAQVERTPEAVALVFGDRRVTYRELNSRANRLARYLKSLGVGPEVLVGICMERCVEMVVGVLGVLKAGGAYVPLDPAYPKERIDFMLRDASVQVFLTQRKLLPGLPEDAARLVCLDSDWAEIESWEDSDPGGGATPDNIAYVLYTSGSTGRPKGAAVLHRGTVAMLHWARELVPSEDLQGVLASTSLCFDPSVFELFVPLSWGGKAILAENVLHMTALEAAGEITLLSTVPSAIAELLKTDAIPGAIGTVTLAGEPLKTSIVQKLCRKEHIRKVCNLYGLTEDAVYSTAALLTADTAGDYAPIGRPIPNTEIYILDDFLQPVPVGVVGEIYIGGAGLPRSYFNRPELTAEKFIPDPFSGRTGARLHKTGDLARYRPDGEIEFLGRMDHQVKVRGFRIELGEIEAVLAQHPGLREALVMVREDEHGEKTLVGYLVTVAETPFSLRELRAFLRQKLPDYMVPTAFVLLPALPLTPNGKVNRRALPPPDEARPEREEAYVAPRTPVEEVLAGVWSRILRVEEVGIHDNFFELGGHSLLATQVVSRARDALLVDLPLRDLFEAPTIAALADRIETALRGASAPPAPAIQPVPREGELPVSFAQQRLWFLDQLEPGNPNYNIPAALRLRGRLDASALERTLAEISRRHESLRTTFAAVHGRPVQIIGPPSPPPLPLMDLAGIPEAEREAEVSRRITEEARQPFDLSRGPLLRAELLRLDEEEHVLVLTMHHVISDGWSIGVLVREIATLYDAFSFGKPSPLPDLPIQYADFALWQARWLQGEALDAQLGYWKKQLAGAPEILDLPTDRPRPSAQSFRGAHQSLDIPADLTRALKALGRLEDVTLFMTLAAAFQTLLHRYTGQEDIVVGTPIANRNRVEIEGLIGFFVNTLAMRADLFGDPTFRGLLRRVRETALGAYAHQDLPFEQLVGALQPQRDLSHGPLFQVMFVLQNAPLESLELSGLTLESLEIETGTAKFDLTLTLVEEEEGMVATLEYNTDLFEEATSCRMLEHFRVLLEGIAADPDRPLSRLPLLVAAERAALVEEWAAGPSVGGFEPRLVTELIERSARHAPGAVAVASAESRPSYRELERGAEELARRLRRLGVGPEVLVGLLVDRSVETVLGILGILKAGGAYVPLDPDYPRERLALMLDQARPAILLARRGLEERLPALPGLSVVSLDDPASWPAAAPSEPDSVSVAMSAASPEADNPAYVIFTSGSTGRPRGVVVSHGSLAHSTAARCGVYRQPPGRFLLLSSFAFDSSVAGIFWTLTQGGTLYLPPEGAQQDPERIVAWIEAEGISHLLALPSLYDLLLGSARPWQLDSLRCVIVAGEPCPAELAQKHLEALPGAALFNEYGPTETTVWASVFDCRHPVTGPRVPIGRPVPGARITVLDRGLEPVPIGVTGELFIGGAGVARGYLRDPEATAERFLPDPFSGEPGARLYRTGDQARRLASGALEFVGRDDFQVKIRGYRIELGDIEAALAAHPGLLGAVAAARQEPGGGRHLAAFVVANGEGKPTTGELRAFLRQKLPDYMVPSAFIFLDSFPRTPTGKLDRLALARLDGVAPERDGRFLAPRTPLEEVLSGIWSELLGVSPVGVDDNFFELGGHSLIATQVVSRVREAFQVNLPLRRIFEHPTVGGLAQALAQAPEGPRIERRAELLLKLALLSDEEVEAMLEQERHRTEGAASR